MTIEKALAFATKAHEGQVRKYTGEPYITHPVAEIVKSVTGDEEMICAALLHDTVEDTSVSLSDVEAEFGSQIAMYIEMLTDVSGSDMGSQAVRKEIDRQHTALAHPNAKTVKLADLIHNAFSINQYDEKFSVVYMAEKKRLLEVLKEGDSHLFARASHFVENYYAQKKEVII